MSVQRMRSAIRVCLSLSAIAVAGCAGGAGGGTRLYSEVSIFLCHSAAGAEVDARVAFDEPPIPDFISAALPPLGTCRVKTTEGTLGIPPDLHFLDAGSSVAIQTPVASLTLPADSLFTYYVVTSAGTYAPSGSYVLAVPGGTDIPMFSTTLIAPGSFGLTSPDVSGAVVVDRAAGLDLTWISSGGPTPVYTELYENDFQGGVYADVVCALPDTGSGSIPPEDLTGFAPSTTAEIEFTASRFTRSNFDVPSRGPGGASVGEVWFAPVTIQ